MMQRFQMMVFYTIWILFLIVISIGYANYHYFGTLSLNLHIVTLLVKAYPFTTIFIIIFLLIVVFYQFKIYRDKIKNRRNCQITYVDLEKIAHLWLEFEEIEDNIEHKMMEKMEVSFDESKKDIQEVINTLIGNRTITDMNFYKKYVFNYLDSFSKQELEIVAVLYELLETKAKELPSVATLYKSDTDKNIYKDIVSEKLTSYEILYKVNLFDHTMNVVDSMYNLLIKEKDSFVFGWSRMLISALSHDIGKIEKIESLKGLSGLDKGKYENNTHENISRLILSNAFPGYEYIDDVCEIIEKHHLQSIDEKNKNYKAIKYLKNADQMARKLEIKEYLNNKKDNTKKDDIENKENLLDEIIPDDDLKYFENASTPNNKNEVEVILINHNDNIKNLVEPEKIAESDTINKAIDNKKDMIHPEQEVDLNPSDIGNLIEMLINSINEVEISPKTKRLKLISISDSDELYIPKDIFTKFVKSAGISLTIEKDLSNLIKKLKSDNVLKYETSNITIDGFGNLAYKSRRDYVVFSLESMGITAEEADLKKRNQEHLRNVTINKGKRED